MIACTVSLVAAGIVVGWLIAFAALGAACLLGGWAVLLRQTFKPAEVKGSWKRGSLGEHLTERELARLGSRQYMVIHDVALGSTSANVDHVVVGPTGIFVLDSKNWRGKATQLDDGSWKYGKPLAATAKSTIAERDWIIRFFQPEVSAWQVPVQVAWVMTGSSQDLEAIGDIEVIDLDKVIDWMTRRPEYVPRGRLKQLFARATLLQPAR